MANGHGGARPNTGRKRQTLPAELTDMAMRKLSRLVANGDKDAVKMVLDRHIPVLKAVSSGIDAKLVEAKIKEITTMAEEIAEIKALLAAQNQETEE